LRWLFDALNSVASSLATFLERNKKKGGLGPGATTKAREQNSIHRATTTPKPQGFALMEKKEK
jgi:hypothetical protein